MRRGIWTFAAIAIITTACGARGDTAGDDESEGPTTTAAAAVTTEFGEMASPCGDAADGKPITLDPAEAGTGTDKLHVGIANERTAEARPGLLEELWNTGVAFANWCNEQGGIGGLEVVPVDLDGKLFKVEAAMTTACTGVFAMAGGAFGQDNQVFTGKDGSDFHKCKLIAFPALTVSTDFGEANGVVQAIGNHGYVKSVSWLDDLKSLYPDEVAKTVVVYPEGLPSVKVNAQQVKAVAEEAGFGLLDDITFQVLNNDFSITAQKVMTEGATSVSFIGETEGFAIFVAELKTKGYQGIVWADTNLYDPKVLTTRGPENAEGVLVREVIHPFEEAEMWPATKQFIDIVTEYGPPGSAPTALGVQSFSASLLLARSVNDCAASNDGRVTRQCVVEAANQITDWSAGGLHAPYDLSGESTQSCSMWLQVTDGEYTRKFPELGSDDDTDDGMHCDPEGLIPIEGDFGQGNVDPTRGY
ncbi:MAG TPA: ABC transporter substrate-binding protein [Microthrixaceae bacterium]|nr:ABC transporter substrate-binding protein [Microthrixaceae bacterium]